MGVNRTGWLLLPVLLAAALFLPALGERTIYISDEARYALLARNMIERGHWLVPHIGGDVHLEKPPLFMWAIAVLSLIPGDVTELTAALPAAVSGIAAPVVARADSGARRPWACVANQWTHVGVCVSDPVPYVAPSGG